MAEADEPQARGQKGERGLRAREPITSRRAIPQRQADHTPAADGTVIGGTNVQNNNYLGRLWRGISISAQIDLALRERPQPTHGFASMAKLLSA